MAVAGSQEHPSDIVVVDHLHKRYGGVVAASDVSFSVREGEIFGIIGPNGAGKTTTVESIVGLRVPDGGSISVMGLDPRTDRDAIRERVGVQLQESQLPALLRVGEAVDLYASFYPRPRDPEEILRALGLWDQRAKYFRNLSGGQKQRLSIALALIGRPTIAVLDELTTGLDPQARRDAWELIDGVRASGVTLVLVTHYMDEAERLCDRIALIDAGRVVALDTPEGLAGLAGHERTVRFHPSRDFADRMLTDLPEVERLERRGDHVVVTGSDDLLNAVALTLAGAGVVPEDLQLRSATLEDAFLALTGTSAHEEAVAAPPRGGGDRPRRRLIDAVRPKATGRRAPRSGLRRLVRIESRIAWRRPIGLVLGVGVPLLLLVVFGTLKSFEKPVPHTGGLTYFDVYLPILMAFVLAILSLVSLPIPLAAYREKGILRRLSVTPAPPSWVLLAQLVVNLTLTAIAIAVILVVGTAVFGAHLSFQIPSFVVSLLLAVAALSALGLWVAAIAPSARAAGVIGTVLLYPLLFFAGLWAPRELMSTTLQRISDFTPLGAAVRALQDSMHGQSPPVTALLVMAAYAVVFGVAAVASFRWE
jgi:ABC-2 type transport system ATP-binding protein